MRRLMVIGVFALASLFLGAAQGAPPAFGDYIVVLKDGPASPAQVASEHGRAYGFTPRFVYSHALRGYAASLPEAALAEIERNPRVLFVAPDREVEAAAAPTRCIDLTQCQRITFGVDRIDGDVSSTRSGDGQGLVPVNVAVLDTGIDIDHSDLNVVGGVDCTGGKGIDDPEGHGTHVAGTIAARDNGVGVVGVAPGARLWAARVLNKQGNGSWSNIICGVDFVTSTRTNGDPTDNIAVANMSLSGPGSDDGNCGRSKKDALHLAICTSVASGVSYVVAAGNSGIDFQGGIPASYDEVLTVSAVTDFDGRPGGLSSDNCLPQFSFVDDTAPFFSDFATLPADQAHTIAAPGLCVLSTIAGGGYDLISGTSQATPHVAGTVALCIFSGPCAGLTAAQIIQKIVADAAAYNTDKKNSGYGFQGDPLRPISGKYYGYLIRAGLY